jgi:threonine aldolase
MSGIEDLRDQCTRFLNWHGNRDAASFLNEIASDTGIDRYGDGGAVSQIEAKTCELLGKPAAVFMPTGTMAQQIALRIHSERRGGRTVGFHPTAHLELHEDKAYQRLHGLTGLHVGDPNELIRLDDVTSAAKHDTLAAMVYELPQREIGGRLPSWADLEAQTEYLRDRSVPLHLDGARLWECTPFYGRALADIAALFDSVYVSFYKGIGALSGCCLAGDEELVAHAREWRHRHGGTLWSLWPLAGSALGALARRLPRINAYVDHAVAIGASLAGVDGVEVVPDPPQTAMMHLYLRTSEEHFDAAARAIAAEQKIFTWPRSRSTNTPGARAVELTVGDATLDFEPAEVADLVARLVG